MKKNIALLLLLFCCSLLALTAQSNPQSQFTQANQAYQRNDFMGAIRLYEAILTTGQESAELYFNLGNAHYKNNDLGRAILNYKKSLLLKSDQDVLNNLQLARDQQPDQLSSVGQTPLQWWDNGVSVFSATTWGILTVGLGWLAVGGFVFWMVGKERSQRKRGFIVGIVLTVLALLFLFFGYSKYQLERNSRQAVLLASEIDLRIAPNDSSQPVNTIHAGVELTLLDKIGEWYQVRLINGETGWLPAESLATLSAR